MPKEENRKNEIRDWAYKESTGQHLTKSFSYDEFQKINTMDYVWEPFEDWDPTRLETQIADIADGIIRAVEHFTKEKL